MKGKYIYLILAMLLSTLTACEEDYFGKNKADEGVMVKMQITANTAFSGVESRAVYESGDNFTAGDVAIDKYCFLLFNPNKMLVRAFDLEPNELPFYFYLPAPEADENPYYAYLLGNVSLDDLFKADLESGKYPMSDGETTAQKMSDLFERVSIDDLKKKYSSISRQFNKPVANEKNKFTWSGYLPLTPETDVLNFFLNPNVAKLTATITNNSANSQVMSVRLKNVVDKVAFAQNALNKSSLSSDATNDVADINYIKYDMEYLEIAQGQSQTISWYVPQNKQGTGNRQSNAPANATYLEIDGVKMLNYITSAYRVYPGANPDGKSYAEMTDFNVSADTIYNFAITIKDDGITTDVNNVYSPAINLATGKVKLPPNSNCYMIHPIGDRIVDKSGKYVTVYELPVDRVNHFWKDVKNDATRTLTADSEWTVEVIWQDIQGKRAIHFCDEYGNVLPDVAPGEGLNPFCFKLVNNSTDPGSQTYGNILVGLKKKGVTDGYLWSWHLWVTDYNPDAAPPHSSSANKLYYTDSKVDRQGAKYDSSSNSWTSTSNARPSYSSFQYLGNVQHYHSKYGTYYDVLKTMWETGGPYHNKWIMDRNIGAQSSNNSEIENPLDGWGMYYQFGRKDPFIYNYTYDINGNRRNSYSYTTDFAARQHWKVNKSEAGQNVSGSLENGVKHPTTYFPANGSWAGEGANQTPNNDWFSPRTPAKKGAKTLFDPCPPGWCVPQIEVFRFADKVYGDATFKEFTRTFIDDMNTSTWQYTAVCSYVNVEGDYVDPKTYSGIDVNSPNNAYNSSLDNYGDNFRNFCVLYSTDLVNNVATKLKSHFPLQGHINGDDGKLVKVFQKTGITPIYRVNNSSSSGSYLHDYICSMYNNDGSISGGAGLQVRMWGVQIGKTSANTIGGALMNIQTSTLGNNVNARQERRNGRLYIRFHGASHSNNVWNASNGFNVRCIQEPD